MDPTDAHEDKENRGAVRPATAGGNGTSRLLQPTASSKQRFGAPDPLAAPPGLRANLNGSTFMHGAGSRPSTARGDFASGAPPALPRPAPSSPPGRATAGVADLSSFRARLNVVKRESMMRQSMIMPHQQDAAHPSSSASMAPIAETASVSSHRGAPDPVPSSAALSLDPFPARDASLRRTETSARPPSAAASRSRTARASMTPSSWNPSSGVCTGARRRSRVST
jgi:hypothetical protein